jgi:hypothetical protein
MFLATLSVPRHQVLEPGVDTSPGSSSESQAPHRPTELRQDPEVRVWVSKVWEAQYESLTIRP